MKLGQKFFEWLRDEQIKKREVELKAPWFYFDSCLLSPIRTTSYGKIPWFWCDGTDGAYSYKYNEIHLFREHHLKIFMN